MSLRKNPRFDLKRKYRLIFNSSIIVSLLLIITAFKFTPQVVKGEGYIESRQVLIEPPDVDVTIQKKHIPPPPKPLIPIEAPIDLDIPDIPIDDNSLNPDAGVAKDIKPYIDNNPVQDNHFFVAVEEDPTPIGGLAAISSLIEYPALAIRAEIEGEVLVRAYVDENGNVVKVELLKSIGGGCDEAALEAVMKTKFKPGRQRGKAVKVKVTVPVSFNLNK